MKDNMKEKDLTVDFFFGNEEINPFNAPQMCVVRRLSNAYHELENEKIPANRRKSISELLNSVSMKNSLTSAFKPIFHRLTLSLFMRRKTLRKLLGFFGMMLSVRSPMFFC